LLAESQINSSIRTVEWKDDRVIMIDQTKLPGQLVFVDTMIIIKWQTQLEIL